MYQLIDKQAPLFTVRVVKPLGGIAHIDLKKLIAQGKWIILFFYPGNFALETPSYITILSDRYEEFKQYGAAVLGISSDTVYTHRAWTELTRQEGGVGPLQIPLASDRNFAVSLAYGVLNDEHSMPGKAVFIIDSLGKIRYIKHYKRQIHYNVDELLAVLSNLNRH